VITACVDTRTRVHDYGYYIGNGMAIALVI
jgi:hypothetical protein